MLSTPLTLTISAVDKTLTRVNQDNFSSVYLLKETDKEYRLDVRNRPPSKGSKFGVEEVERHEIDLKVTDFVTGSDGIKRGQVKQFYTVFTVPRGEAVATSDAIVTGFNTLVSSIASDVLGWAS